MRSQEEEFQFNGEQALRYGREIAFPRRTGTEGEGWAAQTFVHILKELDYEVKEEDFSLRLPPWL